MVALTAAPAASPASAAMLHAGRSTAATDARNAAAVMNIANPYACAIGPYSSTNTFSPDRIRTASVAAPRQRASGKRARAYCAVSAIDPSTRSVEAMCVARQLSPKTRSHAAFQYAFRGAWGKQKSR